MKDQGDKSKKGNVRIPYRDSKLTRILQESLGGRCKTLIVATLSPSATCIEESLSTLHYAQSANGIINKPISNSKMSVSANAFSDTASTSSDPNAVDTWHEMECRLEYMQNQVEEAQAALARKHLQQQELKDRAERAESVLLEKEKELHQANQDKIALQEEAVKEKKQREMLAKLQHETEVSLIKTRAILEATQNTEISLTHEATSLIQSLEASIKNGDQLYSKISEARDDTIQKRVATRNFHEAAASLLKNITAQLENLLLTQQDHLVKLSELAASGYEREHSALADTIGVMDQIKDNVKSITKTIQDHIDGEGGMRVVLDAMKNETEVNCTDVKSLIEEGEATLSNAFQDAHTRLQEYSAQIQSMNSDFLQSSERIASSIESKILESKNKVSAFVDVASKSLAEVKKANAKSCDDLDSVLQSILKKSSSSSLAIINKANGGSTSMTSSWSTFEKKINFDDMESHLNSQNRLMNDDAIIHQKQISELKQVIKSQRESFNQAAKIQSEQQDKALSKIFKGVQQMLREEMDQIRKTNQEQFQKFNATNDNMLERNGGISNSGKTLFSNLKSSTKTLQQNVIDARANDEFIIAAAKDASLTFNELSKATNAHKLDIEKDVAIGTTHLIAIGKQNEVLDATSKKMDMDGLDASAFIANEVANEAQSGLENLNSATSDLCSFASDTILKCVKNDIKTMQDPRADWKTATFSGIEEIGSGVKRSSEIISNIAKVQMSTANELSTVVESTHTDFTTITANSLRQEMENHRTSIISVSQEHSSSAENIISEGEKGVGAVAGEVQFFAENTMQCNDDVEPISKRTKFEYITQLSSTPAESSIIHGLVLPQFKEATEYEFVQRNPDTVKRSASDYRDDASRVETMTCSSDVSTQASMHLSRPPMSNVVLGKENLDTKADAVNSSRSRSRSRSRSKRSESKPRVIKKRAHSRPKAAPSRKRIPTMSTPTKSSDF